MAKKEESKNIQTLEEGDIFFFYRPKVEKNKAKRPSEVQRLFMILSPAGKKPVRSIIIGQKEMPDPDSKGERFWGFVDMVSKDPKSIRDELGGKEYSTKTRGIRHLAPARPAGEGVYRILRHGDHTHLIYALELPKSPSDVQEAFNIDE